MGSIVSGNQRTINGDFMASNYAIAWGSFLKSERLRTISIQAGYRILFSPHANIQPYLSKFALPDYIDVISHDSCSIQEMFCRSSFIDRKSVVKGKRLSVRLDLGGSRM